MVVEEEDWVGGGERERGGGLGCVSAMRVRCVPRVCAALCVVCCAVRCECVCVCLFLLCLCVGLKGLCMYVCVEREREERGKEQGSWCAGVRVWGEREWG